QFNKYPTSVSPDGRFLLYNVSLLPQNDIWALPLTGDRKAVPYLNGPFSESNGFFSPDGKWVAYTSNESGRNEVYVSPFPEPRGKWQISATGGVVPHWRPDGKEIYYFSTEYKLIAVEVNGAGSGFQVGAARMLSELSARANQRSPYDVSKGPRFLVNAAVEKASPTPITLLVNWPALLKK